MSEIIRDVEQTLSEAELLFSKQQVESALDDMARAIAKALAGRDPLLLCTMTGGIVPTGMLLPRLNFPLQLDYVHATRYQGETSGKEVQWLRSPHIGLEGRVVLIIDDILDKGTTMASIVKECEQVGAEEIFTAVLVDKETERESNITNADFYGLKVPDRYVFGYGMDYKDYLRNSDGIYAVRGL